MLSDERLDGIRHRQSDIYQVANQADVRDLLIEVDELKAKLEACETDRKERP